MSMCIKIAMKKHKKRENTNFQQLKIQCLQILFHFIFPIHIFMLFVLCPYYSSQRLYISIYIYLPFIDIINYGFYEL